VGTLLPCDAIDIQLFAAATEITIGDGTQADFWSDRWLQGRAPSEIASSLFKIASRKRRNVKDALCNQRWFLDLNRGLQPEMIYELLELTTLLQEVTLNENAHDSIRWHFEASGEYSARSAYLLQFEGSISSDIAPMLWEGWSLGSVASSFGRLN
jgi:hypothetical protein